MKKINLAIITMLLVFQTVLSPISVFAEELNPPATTDLVPEETATPESGAPTPTTGGTSTSEGTVEEEVTGEQTPGQPDGSTSIDSETNGNGEATTEGEDTVTEENDPTTEGAAKDAILPNPPDVPAILNAGVPQEIPVSAVDFEMLINGEMVTAPSYDKELQQGQTATITFTFTANLENTHAAGDYFTFDLPASIIDYQKNFQGFKSAGPNNPAFSYTTVGQTVTVKLDETITDPNLIGSDVKLIATFESGFNLYDDSLEQEVVIPDGKGGEETVTITFLPSTSNQKISKESKGVKSVNGERIIDWEVWVNRAGKDLNGATLTDNTSVSNSAMHEVILGSVQVTQYEIGLNGYKEDTANPTYLENANFADISLNGKYAYKVNYQTKVIETNPEGEKSFNNTVTLNNGSDSETSDVATQKIKYGDALKKSLVSGDNYKSSWEIKYNYNEVKIDNPVIVDTLPGAHKIDTDTILVYKVQVDEYGNEIGTPIEFSNYSVNKISDGFELKFDDSVTEAYKIKYDAYYTKDFYTGTGESLTNTVTNGTITKTAPHTMTENILRKSRSINFDTKEITWTITVKADNKAINGLKIADTFETANKKGKHTLVGGVHDITINNMTGHTIALIDEHDLSKGFTLTDGTIAKGQTATITYKTSFAIADDGSVVDGGYGNTATAKWTSDETYEITKEADYTPATTTQNNGSKSGEFNYLDQEFTWEVKVNINKKDINGALLTDVLGDGHEINDTSFTVYHYTLTTGDDNAGTRGDILDSSKYDLTVAQDKKGYTLRFKGLDAATNNNVYLIEYKTKDSNHIVGIESNNANEKGDTYTNTAKFKTLGETKTYELTASVKVDVANDLLSKNITSSGNNSNQTITWKIDVNKSHSTLKNVVLTDTPSGNLMLIPDSIQIRPYVVNATGISEGASSTWKNPSEFGVTVDYDKVTGGFSLNFGDLTKKGYQVQYKTIGLGQNGQAFSNSAKITFNDATSKNQETGSGEQNTFSFSSSDTDFQLTKGNAKFKKIGFNPSTGEKHALAGVEFELTKKVGSNVYVIAKATSGVDGYFEFNSINYGTYYVREVAAPDGYSKMDDQLFKLDATTDTILVPDKGTEVENVKVVNSGEMCPNFTLTIKDIDGELVVNKEITLQDDKGNVKFTGTTISEGKVIIPREGSKAVKAGSYKVFDGTEELGNVTVKYGKNECHAELQPTNSCTQFTITLKDKDDNLRVNVAVTLKDKAGNEIISTTTDENGKFKVLPNIPSGKYDLYEGKQFLSEVVVSYKNGCETEVKQAPTCPVFTLTVNDVDGKPREGVTVTIKNVDTNTNITQTINPTDKEGKVKITNLEPGKYVVYDGAKEVGEFTVTTDCEATVQPVPACPQFTLTVKHENGNVRANVNNITIKDKTGATIATNKTTNELGQINIPSTDIPSGEYNVYQGELFIGQITVQYSVNCEAEVVAAPTCPSFTLTVQTEFGTPLANAKITIKDAASNSIKDADNNEILTTSVAGTIVLPNKAIKQGTYYVYEGSRLIGSFTVKDTCSALVKPTSTGGGWTPDPEKPVDPSKPTPDPEKPVDPSKPTPDPEQPVDPEKPTPESEKPVDPEKPVTPGKPETSKPSVQDVIDQGKNLPPYNPSTATKDTLDEYKDFLNKFNNLPKEEQAVVAQSLDIDKIKAAAKQLEAQLNTKGKLPQTDGADQKVLTLIGLLLVLGAVFFLRRRTAGMK
ncbi:collagen binding domain-containing protein [Lysinibacillus sphaericus]|uniref:Collagen adhesion protein n=1 Tax=Lysinibacillus sphaericus OT4b.31 TaxID=1285586 RepID=R7ZIR0_LYSSH|nr:collagen binding domain-containing protein [Lysinibacillus sphaericus]EON73946.1 collagen adhesion protein [Lysinibacillus sphaericus OT4b.31]